MRKGMSEEEAEIIRACCKVYRVRWHQIYSPLRTRKVADARMCAMYLCYVLHGRSLNYIGERFGRSHATVYHAVNTVADSPKIFRINEIRQLLNQKTHNEHLHFSADQRKTD